MCFLLNVTTDIAQLMSQVDSSRQVGNKITESTDTELLDYLDNAGNGLLYCLDSTET